MSVDTGHGTVRTKSFAPGDRKHVDESEDMMRRIIVFSVSILAVIAIHLGVNGQDSGNKPAPKPGNQAAAKADSKPAPKTGADANSKAAAAPTKEPATKKPPVKGADTTSGSVSNPPEPPSPDEKAIRQTAEMYVKAFNEHNAKAVAEQFTPEAEYVNESGKLFQGRAAIEKLYADVFAQSPAIQAEIMIESIRFIGAGIASEDGMTRVTRSKDSEPVITRYTAVHMKTGGKWLVASVRDSSVKAPRQHRNQLKEFDWMLGDWVHEGSDAVVKFSCKPVDNGNFLVRTYTIRMGGEEVMSGSQRIGWDGSMHKFLAWTFDSGGGHSEGYWHRDGDSWVLKSTGTTADGHTASSTTIYSPANPHTMTFQTVDHEVSGIELPDGPKITIVRHAPEPN